MRSILSVLRLLADGARGPVVHELLDLAEAELDKSPEPAPAPAQAPPADPAPVGPAGGQEGEGQ
jgi:hypothetical protein